MAHRSVVEFHWPRHGCRHRYRSSLLRASACRPRWYLIPLRRSTLRSCPCCRCPASANRGLAIAMIDSSSVAIAVDLCVAPGERRALFRHERSAGFVGQAVAAIWLRSRFCVREAGTFPNARETKTAPLVEMPMRSRFDFRVVKRIAELIRERRLRSGSCPYAANRAGRPVGGSQGGRAVCLSRS